MKRKTKHSSKRLSNWKGGSFQAAVGNYIRKRARKAGKQFVRSLKKMF